MGWIWRERLTKVVGRFGGMTSSGCNVGAGLVLLLGLDDGMVNELVVEIMASSIYSCHLSMSRGCSFYRCLTT